jgi:acetyl-CoA synthase
MAKKLTQEQLFKLAISGGITALGYAEVLLNRAIRKYGADKPISYPDTGYELPCFFAWTTTPVKKLGDLPPLLGQVRAKIRHEPTYENALIAGEATMWSAEIVEAIRYIDTTDPYGPETIPGTQPYCGFVGDSILRKLGIAFVDDTIPGALVFVGKARDPKALVKIVRDAQNKGMLLMATFDTIKQLQDEGVKMGLDVMLYPLGEFTQAIHGLSFAIRAGNAFGGVKRGDREGIYNYLSKRPKVVVIQLGPIDQIKAAAEFAVLFNGSPTITDQDIEEIPDKYVSVPNYDDIIPRAIELRDMKIKMVAVPIPTGYGPAFEGESIRKKEMYLEAGGTRSPAFELVRMRDSAEVEDGKIEFVGKEVDEFEEGQAIPLGIIVDVYGAKMQKDFESVFERRIHQFINFGEGCWHTGQRNLIWIRLSKAGVARGLKLKHLGDILQTKFHHEFAGIISKVQVKIMTDEKEMNKYLPDAKRAYAERDARLAGLTDDAVDTFYSCTLCQSFAPNHACMILPERLGLCGAINWLDAKASHQITPTGPNQPFKKGKLIDEIKGQWEGINEAVKQLTRGHVETVNVYSIMDMPMTSCGCFECILAIVPEANGVIVINREYAGDTPVGMKFSTLAGSVGGGSITPGFMGVGRRYLLSKKFIAGDGGFHRILWMPKMLKDAMLEDLKKRAEELGTPDFIDKIADETIATTTEELVAHAERVNHPALTMPPLM